VGLRLLALALEREITDKTEFIYLLFFLKTKTDHPSYILTFSIYLETKKMEKHQHGL